MTDFLVLKIHKLPCPFFNPTEIWLKEQNPTEIKSFNMASVGAATHNTEVCVLWFLPNVLVSEFFLFPDQKTKAKIISQQN